MIQVDPKRQAPLAGIAPKQLAGTAPKPERRIVELDIARGIAIIAVIVGHMFTMGIPSKVVDFCFSFHMPLFFIISGYFMKRTTTLTAGFAKKSAQRLLVPYLATSVIVILLRFLALLATGAGLLGAMEDAGDFALAALYGAGAKMPGMPEWILPIGAIWFLLALYWARLFLAASNMTRCPGAIVLVLFVSAYCMDESQLWLPFSIQAGMGATLFLFLGEKIRDYRLFDRGALHPVLWVAMLIVWVYAIVFCGKLYMVKSNYADGLIDVAGAICGTFCIVGFSRVLNERLPVLSAPLAKLGKITLPVFCMHLVEMDCFPWGIVFSFVSALGLPWPVWVTTLSLRFVLIAIMVAILWTLPRPISGLYFPSRSKRIPIVQSAMNSSDLNCGSNGDNAENDERAR
jgi:fucose 4-O-acetylase-like acetyltransferase